MPNTITLPVAGVRFSKVGKVYHFDARNVPDLQVGDQVVVETSRGWQMGTVAQVVPSIPAPDGMKAIDRKATPRDLMLRQSWQVREEEALEAGRKRSLEIGLVGIKVVSAEYSFDGTRLTIMFSSESEEKYELKSLRQDMQRMFAPAQVEMRQIGPRDVAKMMGGMGACGKETRCCSEFLCEFSSISIRMAKEQGISLTPTEITGMCGRLRCCLIYEYDQYTQARALLPKRNKRVLTAQGEGRVLDQVPIRDAVLVQLADDTRREFKRSEIQLLDENGVAIPNVNSETENGFVLAVEKPVVEEDEPMLPIPPQLDRPDGGPRTPDSQPRPDQRQQNGPRGRSDSRGGRQDRPRGANQQNSRQPQPQQPSRGPERRPQQGQPPAQGRPEPNRGPQAPQATDDRPANQNRNQPSNRRGGPTQPPQGNRSGQQRPRQQDRRGQGPRPDSKKDDSDKSENQA